MALFLFLECQLSKSAAETLFCVLFWVHHFWEPPWLISEGVTSPWLRLSEKTWDPNLLRRQTVVSRTRAENQMETCGVHLDGTLFLPAQGRTPRVPVKAAKGSHAKRSQASSFIGARSKQASYKSGSCGYLCIALGSGGTICLFPVDKNHLSVSC